MKGKAPNCVCASGSYNSGKKCEDCDDKCDTCKSDAKTCTKCAENRKGTPDCDCPPKTYEKKG